MKINFNKSDIYISAVQKIQYPKDGKVEIAFVGRSNVGKSSLINTIVNKRGLARTSGTPGKTRLINFFTIDDKMYFVDLPGYGFAKISKVEKEKWGKMIEQYLKDRKELKLIIQLVDIRHNPTEDDKTMYQWIKYFGYECIVVCTKSDKLNKVQIKKSLDVIKQELGVESTDKVIAFSALDKRGKDEMINIIEDCVI